MVTQGFMTPKSLDYYLSMTRGGTYSLNIDQEEAAAVLKAHDYGIAALDSGEVVLIDRLVSKLKDEIWP